MQVLVAAFLVMVLVLSGSAVVQVDGITAARVTHAQSRAVLNSSNYAGLRDNAFAHSRNLVENLANEYQARILSDPSAQSRLLAGQSPISGEVAGGFFQARVTFTTSPGDGLLGLSPFPAPPAVVSETLENLNRLSLASEGSVTWLQTVRDPLADDPSTAVNESQAYSPFVYRLRVRAAETSTFSQGPLARLEGVREYEVSFRPANAAPSSVPAPPVEPLCSDFGACAPPTPPSVPPPPPPALPIYVRTLEPR
jgi:hypothetical protein